MTVIGERDTDNKRLADEKSTLQSELDQVNVRVTELTQANQYLEHKFQALHKSEHKGKPVSNDKPRQAESERNRSLQDAKGPRNGVTNLETQGGDLNSKTRKLRVEDEGMEQKISTNEKRGVGGHWCISRHKANRHVPEY
jgi:TolA-binding protein